MERLEELIKWAPDFFLKRFMPSSSQHSRNAEAQMHSAAASRHRQPAQMTGAAAPSPTVRALATRHRHQPCSGRCSSLCAASRRPAHEGLFPVLAQSAAHGRPTRLRGAASAWPDPAITRARWTPPPVSAWRAIPRPCGRGRECESMWWDAGGRRKWRRGCERRGRAGGGAGSGAHMSDRPRHERH